MFRRTPRLWNGRGDGHRWNNLRFEERTPARVSHEFENHLPQLLDGHPVHSHELLELSGVLVDQRHRLVVDVLLLSLVDLRDVL